MPDVNRALRPRPVLALLLLCTALAGCALVAFVVPARIAAQRSAVIERSQRAAVATMARSVADSLHLAMALSDSTLASEIAEELRLGNPRIDGVRIRLDNGAEVMVGTFPEEGFRQTVSVTGADPVADLALLGDWPLGELERPGAALGEVEVVSFDPAGVATVAGHDAIDLELSLVLLSIVVAFGATGFLIRRRLLALGEAAAALTAGRFDALPRLRGFDEAAWVARTLEDLGGLLKEQVDRVQGRNEVLERDVADQGAHLERLASFAARLVAPLGDQARGDDALCALCLEMGAVFGALLVPSSEAAGFRCEAAHGFVDRDLALGTPDAPIQIPNFDAVTDSDTVVCLPALDASHPWMVAAQRRVPLQGAVAVPLRYHGRLEAVAVLAARHPWPERQLAFLADAARPLAIALANRRTYASSVTLSRALEARNDELLRQRDELKELGRLKSQFVANMSHELRTPLNAILGYSELLVDEAFGSIAPEQKQPLEGILETGRHLLILVNHVLDLSRAEAGAIELDISRFDVRDLVDEAVRLARPLCRQRPYEVTASAPSLTVQCDRDRLRQIITNLLGNAIKFTPEGSVSVHVRAAPDGTFCVDVTDTGVGIAAHQAELIFEAFRQADGSSTRAHDGVGLGLAISRRLAQAMGGTLEVRSTVGQGSCFSLTLPIRASAPSRLDDSTPPTKARIAA